MFGDDDVSRNIWNEMQRDAMPSPEEAKRDHRQWLAEHGCQACGADDPDDIVTVAPHRGDQPTCPEHRQGHGEPAIFCEACADDRPTWRESRVANARERDDAIAVAFYDCGNEYVVETPTDGPPRPYPSTPDVPVACHCRARLDTIVWLDDDGD